MRTFAAIVVFGCLLCGQVFGGEQQYVQDAYAFFRGEMLGPIVRITWDDCRVRLENHVVYEKQELSPIEQLVVDTNVFLRRELDSGREFDTIIWEIIGTLNQSPHVARASLNGAISDSRAEVNLRDEDDGLKLLVIYEASGVVVERCTAEDIAASYVQGMIEGILIVHPGGGSTVADRKDLQNVARLAAMSDEEFKEAESSGTLGADRSVITYLRGWRDEELVE